MNDNYYIEGEVKEVKFEGCPVLFSLEPNAEFKRKEGDREFALLINANDKKASAKPVPIDEFCKIYFRCDHYALCSQFALLKINRCKIRVIFPWVEGCEKAAESIVLK